MKTRNSETLKTEKLKVRPAVSISVFLFFSIFLLFAQTPGPNNGAYLAANRTAAGAGGSAADSLDTYTRGNSDPISNPMSDGVGQWGSVSGFDEVIIASNEARASAAGTCVAVVTTPSYNNEQWTSFAIGSGGVTAYQGAIARLDSGTGAGYLLAVANSTTVELYLLPAVTLLDTFTTSSMSAGDVIRLEASGTSSTTLTFKKNGSTVDSYVHSSSTVTGGQPAIWLNNFALMDDFRCGNL